LSSFFKPFLFFPLFFYQPPAWTEKVHFFSSPPKNLEKFDLSPPIKILFYPFGDVTVNPGLFPAKRPNALNAGTKHLFFLLTLIH